jgi:hypothetical protein
LRAAEPIGGAIETFEHEIDEMREQTLAFGANFGRSYTIPAATLSMGSMSDRAGNGFVK